MNILYLDDELLNLQVFEFIFGSDHLIYSFISAKKAREFLSKNLVQIDLIVSDYFMPEENGLEFQKNLNQEQKTIPFAILSGFISNVEIKKVLESGEVTHYFEKPIDPDEFNSFFKSIGE